MRSVAQLVLAGVALLLHGCAKSPAGITTGFTKITFRMRVAGKINTTVDDDPATSYIYDVAFRATTDLNPPPNLAPLPVINATNPNGRVGGSPTHFVEFNSLNPVTSFPFTLYKFGAGPTVSDPTNPTDLSKWTDTTSTRGPILSFVQYTPGAKEIQFDIFVNQLGDTDAQGAAMQTLMVQFLTMSRYGNVGSGNRPFTLR